MAILNNEFRLKVV